MVIQVCTFAFNSHHGLYSKVLAHFLNSMYIHFSRNILYQIIEDIEVAKMWQAEQPWWNNLNDITRKIEPF